MRENRTYGSEGGESGLTGLSYPYRVWRVGGQVGSQPAASARDVLHHNPTRQRGTNPCFIFGAGEAVVIHPPSGDSGYGSGDSGFESGDSGG